MEIPRLRAPESGGTARAIDLRGVTVVSLSAHDIDVHVGKKLRDRREALGISQGRLGRHLGLTFSQVQKYEKGSNRIGAGRLFQVAAYLGVQPSYFFESIETGAAMPGDNRLPAFSGVTPEELRQVTLVFSAIPEAETRGSVLALMRSLAQSARQDSDATTE
jgi:transcriptional regulator with XRE-family HTH domain